MIYEETRLFNETNILKNALLELSQRSSMIQASAIVSADGLIKAELLHADIEPNRFGAMCASLLSLAKQAMHDSACGELKLVLLEGTLGTMIVVQIAQKGVLAVSANPEAKIGRLFIDVREIAQKIAPHM